MQSCKAMQNCAEVLEFALPAGFANHLLHRVGASAHPTSESSQLHSLAWARLYRSMNSDGALPLILVSFTDPGSATVEKLFQPT